jgi:hypothetical protein
VVQKGPELDFAIAQDVRIGCASGAVFLDKMGEDAVPVLRREIAVVKADAELAAHGERVLAISLGATGTEALVFFPVLHEQTFDLHALPLQQQSRHRRVDTAGHADDDLSADSIHASSRSKLSGKR